jgi:hypothetical protein
MERQDNKPLHQPAPRAGPFGEIVHTFLRGEAAASLRRRPRRQVLQLLE